MLRTSSSTVLSALDHHAAVRPDHELAVDTTSADGDDVRTYAQMASDVDDLARGLVAAGLRPGDRVALRLVNGLPFVLTLLATFRAGGIAVPTIRQYSPDELRYALEDSGARILILDDRTPDSILDAMPDDVTTVTIDPGQGVARSLADLHAEGAQRPDIALPEVDPASPAVIFYTSGTTAQPKGVVLSHAAILGSSLATAEGWRIRPEDRSYVVLPLFHCNALFMQFVPALLSGATVVLAARFSASRYLDTLRRHRITMANITAGAIRSVIAQPPRDDDDQHDVRILTFGLPLRAEEITAIEERFGIPAYMCYGLTETSAGGTRSPMHIDPRLGWQSLGVSQAGWDVAVRDDDGTDLKPGETGEIHLRGPGTMTRYWNKPAETAAALQDGWLRTGDLGCLDEAGFLFFRGRKKDMLKPKGENVAASEIEDLLDQHPSIAESSVIGVHDLHHEERIVAYVVAADGQEPVDDAALQAYCARRLAAFKVPAEFRWVGDFPRTSIGKINKRQLREEAEANASESSKAGGAS